MDHKTFVATLKTGDIFVQTSETGSYYRGTVARIDRFDDEDMRLEPHYEETADGLLPLFAMITKPAVFEITETASFRLERRAGHGDPDFESDGSASDLPRDLELWERMSR